MRYYCFICLFLLSFPVKAQNEDIKYHFSPVQTAVPSLSIAPDARSGAMGDNGVATGPDIYSQYWNAAKYPFSYSNSGIGLSYTPWLRKLVNDVALISLSGYYKTGKYKEQSLSASIRYFTLGEVRNYSAETGSSGHTFNPYEMAVDIAYSRKLSESYAMGITFRYIRSDMGIRLMDDMQPGNAFSSDISGYFEKYILARHAESLLSLGFNISDIGTRISYNNGNSHEFLPARLSMGTGLIYPLDNRNNFGLYLEISKYLVPSLPVYRDRTEEEKEEYLRQMERYYHMSSLTGIFRSFTDASGGFKEEMKEIMFSIGMEYIHDHRFFVRAGYFYENKNKGNRQYTSLGTGFNYRGIQLDVAYLISTIPDNPLDQTLRFSLSMDMDGIRNLFQ